jgi:membrane protease YdiL (CAAX protease family)
VAFPPAAGRGDVLALGSRRVLAPGRWRWLRALLWGIALFLLVALAFNLAMGITLTGLLAAAGQPLPVLGKPLPGPPAIVFAAMTVGSLAALAAYAGLVRLAEDRRPSEFAPAAAPAELGLGLLLGAAMMAATVLLLWAAGWDRLDPHPLAAIWSAAGNSVESGVVEEILFRLVVLRLLWRAFGPWAALALSALLFGALHLMNPNASLFAALCIALEAGVMLAAFYILTGRLWVSIEVHAGWNFTQGWVFGAAVSGTSGFGGGPLSLTPVPGTSAVLSGGGFGPEASLAGLAVGTAVGAFALHRAWRTGRFAPVES